MLGSQNWYQWHPKWIQPCSHSFWRNPVTRKPMYCLCTHRYYFRVLLFPLWNCIVTVYSFIDIICHLYHALLPERFLWYRFNCLVSMTEHWWNNPLPWTTWMLSNDKASHHFLSCANSGYIVTTLQDPNSSFQQPHGHSKLYSSNHTTD